MSELKVKGKIVKILEVESGTSKAGKEWRKGGFVIDTGSQYNPEVAFSLFGDDKLDMLSSFKEGQEVEVKFNVSSREFGGKYYHNLDAWFISGEKVSSKPVIDDGQSGDDDLPFS
tara:strand:- start:4597 stop:4941 length:345 start_codon:yes stop_codon:yes gene_type:complete